MPNETPITHQITARRAKAIEQTESAVAQVGDFILSFPSGHTWVMSAEEYGLFFTTPPVQKATVPQKGKATK